MLHLVLRLLLTEAVVARQNQAQWSNHQRARDGSGHGYVGPRRGVVFDLSFLMEWNTGSKLTKNELKPNQRTPEGFSADSCIGTNGLSLRRPHPRKSEGVVRMIPYGSLIRIFMLFHITVTIKSFVFSVLNIFLRYDKKEDGMECRGKGEFSGFSFWTVFLFL